MDSIVAELKEGRADDIDVKVERCIAGFGSMRADQQKAISTSCVKLMHACQAVMGQLDKPQQASVVRAVRHCYRCIEASSLTAQLRDILTVAKIAYHIMAKLLNMGDFQAAICCSDCVLKELLLHAGQAASSDIDNIAQNASAALWSKGKSALDASTAAVKDKLSDDVTRAASLLGRSLCFASLCSLPDGQLIVANFERVTNKIAQHIAAAACGVSAAGADPDCSATVAAAALSAIVSLYADLIALPWSSVMSQLRLLACIQSTTFLVKCKDTAAALTRLDAGVWGLTPMQQQQHTCPAVSAAWAVLSAALRLYVVTAGGAGLPLYSAASDDKKPRVTSLADLTESLDQFSKLIQVDPQLHADELLWLAVVDPVHTLLESVKDRTRTLTDVTSQFRQHGGVLVKFMKSFLSVLGLYQEVLLTKLDAQSRPLTTGSGSAETERRRIVLKRLQQSAKASISAVTILLTAAGLLDSDKSSVLGQVAVSVATADICAALQFVEQVAAMLEAAAVKEPELTKELAYTATLLHNAGLKLMGNEHLNDATQLLKSAARLYECCSSIKASGDVQDKWRASLAGLCECYQRNGSWIPALCLVVELLKTGVTIDKCLQQWVGVKRSFVKRCVAPDQNLNDPSDSKLIVLTTTMRESLTTLRSEIAEEDIVDILLKELKAYIAYSSSSTNKANAADFYMAELAVIKDLLSSHAVVGCHRAYAFLRRAQLQQILSTAQVQSEAAIPERSLLEDCEAALSALSDDQSSTFCGDVAALAYFTSYAIQHLGALTMNLQFIEANRQQGDVANNASGTDAAVTFSKPSKFISGHQCNSLALLDRAISLWSTSIKNGGLLYCEQITLSCIDEAASIFALFDMPGREFECLQLIQLVLRQISSSFDIYKEWYEQQSSVLARLVSVSLRLGLLDEAKGYLTSLLCMTDDSTRSKVPCYAIDMAQPIVALAEAEWLLVSGQVDKAVAKADQVLYLYTGGSSGSDSKAALTCSKCLYMGIAYRLLAVAGSEHGSVCLPRCIGVLEYAHEAVRMHTSLYSFVTGKRECSSWPSAKGDVRRLIALKELLVSLDVSVAAHLLAEDVRSVRCYCKEGLGLSHALPLRAVAFLLHLAKTDSLSAAHGDCQMRLGSAAHLLNAAAADADLVESWCPSASPGRHERLTCARCCPRHAADGAQRLSLVSEGSNDSEDSFIKSKLLEAAGGDLDRDYDDHELGVASAYGTDLSADPTASPRLPRRPAPAAGLATVTHEQSCACVSCGGGDGRFAALQQLLVVHTVRQSEATLAEGQPEAAERLATDALLIVERFVEKAQRWPALASMPAWAAAAASATVFAKPAIAAGRALLEATAASGDRLAAERAWQALVQTYAADQFAGVHESKLAEAEVFLLLPALSRRVTDVVLRSLTQVQPALTCLSSSTGSENSVPSPAADDGGTLAVSPCADGPSFVAKAPRQKVKKSRVKKAVHFDDSDLDGPLDDCSDPKVDACDERASYHHAAREAAGSSHVQASSLSPAKAKDTAEPGAAAAATPRRTTPLKQISLNTAQAEGTAKQFTVRSAARRGSTRVRTGAKAKENAVSAHTAGSSHFTIFLDESSEEQQQQSMPVPTGASDKRSAMAELDERTASLQQQATSSLATPAVARQGRRQLSAKEATQHGSSAAAAVPLLIVAAASKGKRQSARQRTTAAPAVETLRAPDSDSGTDSPPHVVVRPRPLVARSTGQTRSMRAGTADRAASSSSSSSSASSSAPARSAPLLPRDLGSAASACDRNGIESHAKCDGKTLLRGAKRQPIMRKDAPAEVDRECMLMSSLCRSRRVLEAEMPALCVLPPKQQQQQALVGSSGDSKSPMDCQSLCVTDLCHRLEGALGKLRHFPPAAAYRTANLALAAAYHHLGKASECAHHICESAALTFRHIAQRNYSRKLRRATKTAVPEWRIKQLSLCQELLQFGRSESFSSVIERLPDGWTVCQLSVIQLPGGCTGDSSSCLYIARLQRGHAPLVCLVPAFSTTGKDLLTEFADIMTCSSDSMLLSGYKDWWTERARLNKRLEELTKHLESRLLCCWKGMLLGSRKTASSPLVTSSLGNLRSRFLDVTGLSEGHFQVWLDGAATCSTEEVLQSLTLQLEPRGDWQPECIDTCTALEQLARDLVRAATSVSGETVGERHPTILVLDKRLQHLPWESTPILRSQQVTRMPSLAFVDAHLTYHRLDAQSITNVGIDDRKTFYVLNPDDNLSKTEDTFKTWFMSEKGWNGIIGREPSGQQLVTALAESDIFLYCGHGSGSKYLDGESIQTLSCRPASVLMGCSSGALVAKGSLDAAGMVLNYFLGGCPCIIANLWDVTDRDIDRFLKALLSGWMAADGSNSRGVRGLLNTMGSARGACKLPFMIGAAPVAYGLPVVLK